MLSCTPSRGQWRTDLTDCHDFTGIHDIAEGDGAVVGTAYTVSMPLLLMPAAFFVVFDNFLANPGALSTVSSGAAYHVECLLLLNTF